MKDKICKVINSCNNCHHLGSAQEIGGNTWYAAVCKYPKHDKLIAVTSNDPRHYTLGIPDDCPLEDYNGSRNIIEEMDEQE